MNVRFRDHKGAFCNQEKYAEEVAAGLIKAGDNLETEQPTIIPGITAEEMDALPTSMREKITAYVTAMFDGPVMGNMVQINKDAGALAIRNRIGGAANNLVREKLARPLLPTVMHPYLLDNPVGSGLLDLGVSNTGMALMLMFGNRLPDRLFQGGMALSRCMTTAAYSSTLGAWNPEEYFSHFISGDLANLAKEALDLKL